MKKLGRFFNKYWYLMLICGIGFGVFIWLVQPFSPDIWGTVSDWAMVLVATLTAIFLILTFKEQHSLTRIEVARHKENLRPVLMVDTRESEVNRRVITQRTINLVFWFEKNVAKDIVFEFSSESDVDSIYFSELQCFKKNRVLRSDFAVEANYRFRFNVKYKSVENVEYLVLGSVFVPEQRYHGVVLDLSIPKEI
ncbi:hypothetical protein [Echinicola shivajiensis]|uniref:hypothetical protein n=1 Tax=Echinicola shivajiensis TaxID=1035916 RepID=UPI001BFC4EC1|nr:hypothetical protein [Echinicola shivajiensis]